MAIELSEQIVVDVLEQLWTERKSSYEPATTSLLVQRLSHVGVKGAPSTLRRKVRSLLKQGPFVRIKEVGVCGEWWYCYIHRDSQQLTNYISRRPHTQVEESW